MIITIKDPMPIKSVECWKAGSKAMNSILSIVSNKQPSIDSFVESLYIRCHFCLTIHTRILKTFCREPSDGTLWRQIRISVFILSCYCFGISRGQCFCQNWPKFQFVRARYLSRSVFEFIPSYYRFFWSFVSLDPCFCYFSCQHKQWTDCFSFQKKSSQSGRQWWLNTYDKMCHICMINFACF